MINLFPIIPDAPPPFPAVTDRNVAHWIDEGTSLIRSTGEALGLPPLVGSMLDATGIRTLTHHLVAGGKSMLRGLTKLLVGGTIGLGGWFKSMLSDLLPRQFAAGLATLGIGAAPQPIVDQANAQAGFLVQFRDQIADADQLLDASAVARAAKYGSAVWGLAQNLWRGRMLLLGYAQERRFLGVADHCTSCLEEAAKKWRPIGTLKPIGATECVMNCRCWFQFR